MANRLVDANGVELRFPTVFKRAVTASAGAVTIWTPATGKKFRLLRYKVEVTTECAVAAGGVQNITLLDEGTNMNLGSIIFLPTTSVTTGLGAWVSGWIDLGAGYLSAAANNSLKVSMTANLTAGNIGVNVAGVEE